MGWFANPSQRKLSWSTVAHKSFQRRPTILVDLQPSFVKDLKVMGPWGLNVHRRKSWPNRPRFGSHPTNGKSWNRFRKHWLSRFLAKQGLKYQHSPRKPRGAGREISEDFQLWFGRFGSPEARPIGGLELCCSDPFVGTLKLQSLVLTNCLIGVNFKRFVRNTMSTICLLLYRLMHLPLPDIDWDWSTLTFLGWHVGGQHAMPMWKWAKLWHPKMERFIRPTAKTKICVPGAVESFSLLLSPAKHSLVHQKYWDEFQKIMLCWIRFWIHPSESYYLIAKWY